MDQLIQDLLILVERWDFEARAVERTHYTWSDQFSPFRDRYHSPVTYRETRDELAKVLARHFVRTAQQGQYHRIILGAIKREVTRNSAKEVFSALA